MLDQSPGWSDAVSAHCLLPALLQPQDLYDHWVLLIFT